MADFFGRAFAEFARQILTRLGVSGYGKKKTPPKKPGAF